MAYKISKFGGTSVAAGLEGIHKIAKDEGHNAVVLSGPGGATRLTDHLIACANTCDTKQIPMLMDKFLPLSGGEDLTPFADTLEQRMLADVPFEQKLASIKAFGEETTARLFAKRFGFRFIDPMELFLVKGGYDSAFVEPSAYSHIREILGRERKPCVIPGFYGANEKGHIATFKRGGSDYSGSIIAAALIDIFPGIEYHNFSDKDGIMASDPRVVKNPRKIDEITYREYFCLARSGSFSIFQKEAVLPLSEKNVQLYVRNTFNPENKGTLVKKERLASDELPFMGIGKEDGYSAVNVYHPNMDDMVGVIYTVAGLFKELNIPISALPTSDPGISVVFRESDIEAPREVGDCTLKPQEIKKYLLETIEERVPGASCGYFPDISRIVVVGKELKGKKAVSGRIQTSLGLNNCNILFISQGLDEIQLTYGVEKERVNEGVNAVYDNFLR